MVRDVSDHIIPVLPTLRCLHDHAGSAWKGTGEEGCRCASHAVAAVAIVRVHCIAHDGCRQSSRALVEQNQVMC